MTEYSNYDVLQEAMRAKLTRQSSRHDVEKIKKDLCCDVEKEFRKKSSNYHLKPRVYCAYHENMIVCLHLIKN